MATSVKELLAQANQAVPRIAPEEAKKKLASGEALLLDVRDANELQAAGKLKGALHVSRGMLEFRADPESQYYNPEFRKDRTIILHCASGGRSALAGKTLKDLGYSSVFNLGGYKDAVDGGMETET
jgi:rhodanese-related sulfurtransferase